MDIIIKSKTTLGDLAPGSLFIYGTTLCFKSEYRDDNTGVEAYIVNAGCKFSGGITEGGIEGAKKLNRLEVIEIEISGL